MTEQQMRMAVVSTLQGWLGTTKGSQGHRNIIDTYNAHPDLPLRNGRPYKMSYTDDWCAGTVSAAAIANRLTDIMPVECSCNEMIRLYQALGRWVEDDAYIPQPGDVPFYAWKDDGVGDCKLPANHVGVVESVDIATGTMTVIEGNMGSGSKVGRRTMKINGRYIRGYGIPDYAGKVDKLSSMSNSDTKAPWYAESWAKATDLGLVDGTRPEENITRAEVAEIVLRALYGQKGAE